MGLVQMALYEADVTALLVVVEGVTNVCGLVDHRYLFAVQGSSVP